MVLDGNGGVYNRLASYRNLSESIRGAIWEQTRRHPPWQYAVMPSKDVLLSILEAACCDGELEVVRGLLETEKDVGWLGGPLYEVCSKGHVEILKLFTSRGVDLNEETGSEYGSLLQEASSDGRTEIVNILLSSGADCNIERGFCGSALYLASKKGHVEVVNLLLSSGADIDAMYNGVTPLEVASQEGHAEVVKLLLSGGVDIDAMYDGYTPLVAASRGGHVEVVNLLLSGGADINAMSRGDTPQKQHPEKVMSRLRSSSFRVARTSMQCLMDTPH